jgi:hypothetical protein
MINQLASALRFGRPNEEAIRADVNYAGASWRRRSDPAAFEEGLDEYRLGVWALEYLNRVLIIHARIIRRPNPVESVA